jgi:SAM-dependent methyltransferase
MDIEFLRAIRLYEMDLVIRLVQPGQTVLEIGAGAGWQAHYMALHGFKVIALDVPGSNYDAKGNWPVIVYDGGKIPLAKHSVDVVFSSNVLEHILHVEAFQPEILRVLKPDGCAIHLMPTPTWRFWTSVAMYIDNFKRLTRRLTGLFSKTRPAIQTQNSITEDKTLPPLKERLFRAFWPSRHGEIGNSFTELYYFSRRRWITLFKATGWCIDRVMSNRLFYSGYMLFGPRWGLHTRKLMSYLLGSACMIYLIHPGRVKKC